MSLSSLGRQLAALNSAPGNGGGGSVLPSSTRHDDAVGRGLAHSVRVGHSTYYGGSKSHLHKPSIIYEDSRKASDVPLTTIRENCIASLRVLQEDFDEEFGKYVSLLCKDGSGSGSGNGGTSALGGEERGLLTSKQNEVLDKHIKDLLYRLALRFNSKQTITECLHVIEFLLRKYDIHARTNTSSTLILVCLPCHEEPFFLRLLQLIDLASMQTYSFLRPYAIPNSTIKPPRTVLAKQITKDTSLLREICYLSQRNSKLPNSSQSLSFTAAVLVEAMALEVRQYGSMYERTIQALLPAVMTACRSSSSIGYMNWGHVLASSIIECCVLATDPKTALISNILYGISGGSNKNPNNPNPPANPNNSVVLNGLILVLSILAQPPIDNDGGGGSLDASPPSSYQLEMINQSGHSNSDKYHVGYAMEKTTFNALLKVDDLATKLGKLYFEERIVQLYDWIASILVVAYKRVAAAASKGTGRKNMSKSKISAHGGDDEPQPKLSKSQRKQKATYDLLMNLISEPKLDALWKSKNSLLIASFTSHVVQQQSNHKMPTSSNFNTNDDDVNDDVDDKEMLSTPKLVLQALRRKDVAAYDEGIAHALLSTPKRENRHKLATWLGLKKSSSIKKDGNDDPKDDNDILDIDDKDEDDSGLILPPRVALEHAVPKVRLEAIPRVLEEFASDGMEVDDEDSDGHVDNDGRRDLLETLLRRFSMEEDDGVALATGLAIREFLKKYKITSWEPHAAETALDALYKWTEVDGANAEKKVSILSLAISIVSYAAKSLGEGEIRVRLVEAIGGHAVGSDDQLRQDAIDGLLLALSTSQYKANKKSKLVQVNTLLVSNDILLSEFCRSIASRVGRTERSLRRRFVTLMLGAWKDCLEQNQKKNSTKSLKIASASIDYCLWALKFLPDDITEKELELISTCLNHSSKPIASNERVLPAYINTLASESGEIFEKAVAPFIQEVCRNVKDRKGNAVSPIAVLMEMALASDSAVAVENLLTIASQYLGKDEKLGYFYGVLPALALVQHADSGVRAKSIDILCSIGQIIDRETNSQWKPLSVICQFVSKNRSKATMGDASLVTKCLVSAVRDSDSPSDAQNCILRLCVFSAAAVGNVDPPSPDKAFKDSWLTARPAFGGFRAASAILNATELAGEATFPLLLRWDSCGKVILDGLLAMEFTMAGVPQELELLIDSVTRMLKGVTVTDSSSLQAGAPNIIISTGPAARGGRARSYSVGKSDGLSFLEPYPQQMQTSLVAILSPEDDNQVKRIFRNAVVQVILLRDSWGHGVFTKLSPSIRRVIGAAVLANAGEDLADDADQALLSLPMDASDVCHLLSSKGDGDNTSLALLAGYVSANSKTLMTADSVNDLVVELFRLLAAMSTQDIEDVDEIDFVRQSVAGALKNVVADSGDKLNLHDEGRFGKWRKLLIGLVGGTAEGLQDIRPLLSLRAKLEALSLLAELCSKDPRHVVGLIPAMLGSAMDSNDDKDARSAFEAFAIGVPVFVRYARSAELSLSHLFSAFAAAVNKVTPEDRKLVFSMSFVRSLLLVSDDEETKFSLVGGLAACVLACEVYENAQLPDADEGQARSSALLSQILESCDALVQLEAVLSLVVYAKNFMTMLNSNEYSGTGPALLSLEQLENLALQGPIGDGKRSSRSKVKRRKLSSKQRRGLMGLCQSLMLTVSDALASDALRRYVRKGEETGSNLSLRLWQNLLLIQSSCFVNTSGNGDKAEEFIWKTASDLANDGLECLQNDLPCHIFLASATSLIKEGETGELRARAVRLIADRALQVEASSPEASLFRDMVPFLVDILKPSRHSSSKQDGGRIILQQSALVGIENIARASWVASGVSSHNKNWASQFAGAMSECADVLDAASKPLDGNTAALSEVDGPSRQLICSAALCTATLVRVCGPKCIPTLPMLMAGLIRSLCAANSYIGSTMDEEDEDTRNQAKMMQLSVLRALVGIVDTLPQFLGPYLKNMLSPLAIPSEWLRSGGGEHEYAIKVAADRLEETLATRVPARQLIPAASSCLVENASAKGMVAILSTLNASVKATSGPNLSAQRPHLLRAATFAFDFENTDADRQKVMDDATDLMLSLILKLSEVQLRQLYGKLRDWRGELDKSEPQTRVMRRLAFWNLSSRLGKELRSIFLPCLSTVFTDAVDELVSFCPTEENT